ncbi:GNAT family N-acetyltransferase [Rhizobium sp. TRM96647]|uniref:GNAT family N-acetyltransferase n=1 Tax=unclassified Rhizobium TaxID=2613769 RepID=UPI0021E97A6C|nr:MULTISPECIES: GNAT family N-acetyltransferase [unclassified Rhizobium]MCV3736417.1 GNAT family N-acetyltransferase [Rhizobium sp. TRM96647]MCV3758786.1 GNAT family N-acetyltransferase [Rhizobium sp. TRM96650]
MDGVRILGHEEATARIDELAEVLVDCVMGGASVGFMAPYGRDDAYAFWQGVIAAVADGSTLLFCAERDGRIAGTVQVGMRQMPNQGHRADIKKLLVKESERGRGLARELMAAAEEAAAAGGKTVLVLDTATGSPAESVYRKLGWQWVGVIPDYALYPDGSFCSTTLFYKRVGPGAAAA